jgi:hypothetical protein
MGRNDSNYHDILECNSDLSKSSHMQSINGVKAHNYVVT